MPERVRVSYVPSLPSLPLFVADDQGLFAKHGLEPKLENKGFDVPGAVGAVLTGQADVTYVAYFAILATELQNPGSCSVLQHEVDEPAKPSVYALLARPGAGISSVKDLKGKKLGVFGRGFFEAYARTMIRHAALDPGEVTIVPIDPPLPEAQFGALAQGEIDALLTLEPIGTIAEVQNVAVSVDRSPLSPAVLPHIPTGAALASRKSAGERADFIRAVADALDDAVDFIDGNPGQMGRIYEKYQVVPPPLGGRLPTLQFWTSAKVKVNTCQRYADYLADNGVLPGKIDVAPLYPVSGPGAKKGGGKG